MAAEERESLKREWSGCAYCSSNETGLQKDCVQPISQGGRYTVGNVVPACGFCNASKSNSEVTSRMRRKIGQPQRTQPTPHGKVKGSY
ncbi:HNH endonuclease signature motif containing protein [Salinibacterium sp. TMP30]|uniref:HNH endonuclease n=1 Tax=Salinibacterium sp. TMP30 TaxID=3138237 RepID=UPI00313A2DBA